MKKRFYIPLLSLFMICLSAFATELPLDTVLKRTMSAAEKYNGLVEKYQAEVYTRTYVETLKKNFLYKYTHLIPQFVLHDRNENEALIETFSTFKFDYPNNYVQDIHYVTGTLTAKRDIDLIPFNLLNINIYGETSNDESLFMPVRQRTKKYYRYKMFRIITENEKTYYTIQFTPIYENPNLLKGSFVVESGTWRITQFRGEGMDIFSDYSFEISMGNEWITNYLPVEFTIFQNTSYLGNTLMSRHLSTFEYTDIVLHAKGEERERSLNISNFYKVRLDSVPIHNDTVLWNKLRTIPLQRSEEEVLHRFAEKQEAKQARRATNDSLPDSKKAQQFAQRMVMDSNYEYKTTRIGYSGLLNPLLLGYTSHDGITYRQKLSFNIDLHHNRTVKINAFAGYMFKRKELFTDVTTVWNYAPFNLGSATLSIGNGNPTYSSLFVEQIRDSLINKGLTFEDIAVDYYKDYYLKAFNTFEVTNGLLLHTGLEYHIRTGKSKPQTRSTNGETENIERLFGTRRAFMPFIRISWTPEQYYRYDGRQKIYVRSRFPTFKLELSRSFQGILGSTSEYNRIEFDMNQNIPIGLMSSLQYHIGAGKFINQKTEYFADFVYFSKSNFPETWNDGLGGIFNLLSRELYNASDSYIQAHVMLEAPFLVLKNIPFVSDFADKERFYFSQLYTPQIISYTEFGYGIGNRFFTAGLFGSFHKLNFRQVGLRAAFEF